MTSSKPPVGIGLDGNGLDGSDDRPNDPACLLQSNFADKYISREQAVAVDEGAETMEVHSSRPWHRQAVLFEAESLEGERMRDLQKRSDARSRGCFAHLALLRRRTEGLEASRQAPNKELDKLVDEFISAQSGSEDVCSSQLMEAKHQLNQIHDYVNDLSVQINSTEKGILALDKEMQDKLKEMAALSEWRKEELDKCQKQKEVECTFGKPMI